MPAGDAERWDARWTGWTGELQPARVLTDFGWLLPPEGHALEVACGLGANAELLASRGLAVAAWDVSAVAIAALAERCPTVDAAVRDVVAQPPPPSSCDVLVCTRFLDRGLCPALAAALRPGGLLFVQTFAREAVSDHGPRNPAFRLAPGELLTLFAGLRPVAFLDAGRLGDPAAGLRDESLLVAQRPI